MNCTSQDDTFPVRIMETLARLSKLFGKTFFSSYFVIIIFSFIILYDRFLYTIAPLTWKQLSQKMLSFTTLMHGHLKTREGHGPYSSLA